MLSVLATPYAAMSAWKVLVCLVWPGTDPGHGFPLHPQLGELFWHRDFLKTNQTKQNSAEAAKETGSPFSFFAKFFCL
jgi:hypothetical protein